MLTSVYGLVISTSADCEQIEESSRSQAAWNSQLDAARAGQRELKEKVEALRKKLAAQEELHRAALSMGQQGV